MINQCFPPDAETGPCGRPGKEAGAAQVWSRPGSTREPGFRAPGWFRKSRSSRISMSGSTPKCNIL